MEEIKTIYEFFHSDLFLIILGAALVNSGITFRSYVITRAKNKKDKGLEAKGISLWLSAGLPFLGWSFYSMSFQELGFDMLNLVVIVTYTLVGIVAFVAWHDRWKLRQKTLERYF